MVKSASLAAVLALDSGFRRVILPLVLLAGKYRQNYALFFTHASCLVNSVAIPLQYSFVIVFHVNAGQRLPTRQQ